MSSPQSRSAVRVGVRVRPLASHEIAQDSTKPVVLCHGNREIRLADRRFTYDAVFDDQTAQEQLYQSVAPPLLEGVLEGYNATIMAYGQTGSGKTFTMGSEAHRDMDINDSTGLIPRFMTDLFQSLQRKQEASSEAASAQGNNLNTSVSFSKVDTLIEYSMEASFLEVYGEDVHDLLLPNRPSIPIREDGKGGVVCSGLTQKPVKTAQAALQVLHDGTLHRTTAATLMNLTSSRSHAVFTITLTQITLGEDGVEVSTVSRFTFVDLAGSERMKKTGAEGERAKEGIKINEGLLALGNVINALSDGSGKKKQHVPYRDSKLTRLLQDALGGNSQTLFLACVSPASINSCETINTLRYAHRARNIKNAPIQNVDAAVLELQKLRSWSTVLQQELVQLKFAKAQDDSKESCNVSIDKLLERDDVREYLSTLMSNAESKQSQAAPLPLLSIENVGSASSKLETEPLKTPPSRVASTTTAISSGKQAQEKSQTFGSFDDVNPDDDMEILNRLLEMQQLDQEYQVMEKEENQKLDEVNGELAKEQALLLQLRDSLKVYRSMKDKFEVLMIQVQEMEKEKSQLSKQLEKATADPTQGCSTTIRRNMENVDRNLTSLRNEIQENRKKCRLLEKEAQKCQVLERKIADLKHGKAELMKKQKTTFARHKEDMEDKRREITTLKRKERKVNQQVSRLQNEVDMKNRNLEKRENYINKLNGKLKDSQQHLKKLLSMRQRDLKKGAGNRRLTVSKLPPPKPDETVLSAFAGSTEEVESTTGFLKKAICNRVRKAELEQKYEASVADYSTLMRSMRLAVEDLRRKGVSAEENEEQQQKVLDMELKSELLSSDLERLKADIAANEAESSDDEAIKKLIEAKESRVLRSLVLELLEFYATAELTSRRNRETSERKGTLVESLEREVEMLQQKVDAMSKGFANTQSDEKEAQGEELKVSVEKSSREIEALNQALQQSRQENRALNTDAVEAKEKLLLVEVSSTVEARIQEAEPLLTELQAVLRTTGRPETEETLVKSLQNAVKESIQRQLDCARSEQSKQRKELESVTSRVASLTASLSMEPPTMANGEDLLTLVQKMSRMESELRPKHQDGMDRRQKLIATTQNIMESLGINVRDLSAALSRLMLKAPSSTESVVDVSDGFLSQCESELSALRLKKSELLVENRSHFEDITKLLKQASITANVGLTIVKRRSQSLPAWWDAKIAAGVASALTSEPNNLKMGETFSKHLRFFRESLARAFDCRRDLSGALKDIVEHAQKSLLQTVDGEAETMEAYASFHDALFKLPELSKDRINTFMSEIEALASCVEAMTQSEVEALTVVWEALNVSGNDRGAFWESVDSHSNDVTSEVFDRIVEISTKQGEDWLPKAAKTASKEVAVLKTRLNKLDSVHKEVEKLRTRQDAKSNVLSLDSQVRILNAQLAEFENTKCNKSRLLTRQTGSAHLLKEERYRKQMKAKFTRKLEQLANLLKAWNQDEGKKFDSNILSEDVRMLLENSDQMGVWIDQRKEFMHLRTVKTDRKKRRLGSSSSTESDESNSNNRTSSKRSRISPKPAVTSSGGPKQRSKPPASPAVTRNSKKRAPPAMTQSTDPPKRARSNTRRRENAKPDAPATKKQPHARPFSPRTTITNNSSANDTTGLSRKSSRSASPSQDVFSMGSNAKPAKRVTRSSARTHLSPAPPNQKEIQPSGKRVTRAAAAAAKAAATEGVARAPPPKRLVLPPFQHVLDQASLSPHNESLSPQKENYQG